MSIDQLLAGGRITPVAEVVSSLGGRVLAEIPIARGSVIESASGAALGTLRITVPASDEWIPSNPGHPLAAYGQELSVRRGFISPTGDPIGWEHLGTFVVQPGAAPSGGWLEVDAVSTDVRLTSARWIVATETAGSLRVQIQQICAGVVPVRISVPDVAIAARTWEQGESRRDALLEVLDAAGAVLRMVGGQLTVLPASSSRTPSGVIRGGRGGTLVTVSPVADGEVAPNAVVASSAPTDSTAPISAMATVDVGPRRYAGPYGPVPTFFASPLLATYAQCQAAAGTRLSRLQAGAPDLTVDYVTDPRVRLDAVRRIVSADGATDCVIRVVGVEHALTRGAEPGQLTGTILSGRVKGALW